MNAAIENNQSIHVDYDLPHPPAKVWRALTEPEILGSWLMTNDFRPVIGHRFTFQAAPMPGWDGVVHCEVLEAEAPRVLRYSWRGGPEGSRLDTIVHWTLTPTPAGTKLTLEHSGFLPANAFAFAGLSKGWRGTVGERLAAVLNAQ